MRDSFILEFRPHLRTSLAFHVLSSLRKERHEQRKWKQVEQTVLGRYRSRHQIRLVRLLQDHSIVVFGHISVRYR